MSSQVVKNCMNNKSESKRKKKLNEKTFSTMLKARRHVLLTCAQRETWHSHIKILSEIWSCVILFQMFASNIVMYFNLYGDNNDRAIWIWLTLHSCCKQRKHSLLTNVEHHFNEKTCLLPCNCGRSTSFTLAAIHTICYEYVNGECSF